MAKQLRNAITAAIRAPFLKRGGLTNDISGIDYARDNATPLRWRNAADTADVDALNVDSAGAVLLNGKAVPAGTHTFTFKMAANASLENQQFCIVPFACRVTKITEVHSAAGTHGSAVTAYIEKLTSTTAVGSGIALHTAVSMKTTANTPQTATLSTLHKRGELSTDLDLAAGDRLGIVFTGTLTTLAGVVFTISVTPAMKGEAAVYAMNANGSLADQSFFVANRPCTVSAIYYAHAVKGTNGSAVNLQVTKDTSTDAPGAGTDLLTNNTNAGFDCKGANYTVQTGTLTATAATLRLAAGDRLSVDFAGTLTALAGVVVVVLFAPIYDRREISWTMLANGSLADQAFWVADGDYQLIDARYVNSVAGNDGGNVNVQLVKDIGTDAPGAGTDLLTDNSTRGFDCKSTANTVAVGTPAAAGTVILMNGDRLSVDFGGTLTTLAGVTITASLKPI